LTLEPVRNSLRDAIALVRRNHPFAIDAWVLLPDHLHCIWTLPVDDADFSVRWSIIKRLVSQQSRAYTLHTKSASRQKRRELPFWQRRFWEHRIRDESDFERHADYIHWNPVKHGWVTLAADWPYSTFHRYRRQGIYSSAWGGTPDPNKNEDGFGE